MSIQVTKPEREPKYLPLCREVAITCGDAEYICIVVGELRGSNEGIVWFRGGMHLGKNFIGEGLGDSENRVRYKWW